MMEADSCVLAGWEHLPTAGGKCHPNIGEAR